PPTAVPPPIPDTTPPLPMDALEEIEAEASPVAEFEADTKTPIAPPEEVEKLIAKSTRSSAAMPAILEAELPDGTTKSVAMALEKMAPMPPEQASPALPAGG